MTLREFMRFHLLKTLLALVVIQIAVVAYVQNMNHKPVAETDNAVVFAGQRVKVSPLTNDMDKDEKDTISLMNIGKPLHGNVSRDESQLIYVPEKTFAGSDSFTYTITDGRKESKPSWIVVKVNENQKPVAGKDVYELYSGGSCSVEVLANDMDREGDSVFIKGYSNPRYGAVSLVENTLVYASSSSQSRVDSFKYVISDGLKNSDSAAVVINIKSKSDPCFPWLSADIGNVSLSGSFTCMGRSVVLQASGSDIWDNADGFRFAYQCVSGDCELQAKIESFNAGHEWAKAGIMIRETLAGGSKCAFTTLTNKNGATWHHRFEAGQGMEGGNNKQEIKAPYWVKIVRKGNTINHYISANGAQWELLNTSELPMKKEVYIGFALTSHDNGALAKAAFSNYSLKCVNK